MEADMAKISIENAFCETRQLMMSIEDAREDFSQYGQELLFLCPDEVCRKLQKPARMSAVNYKAETYIKTPHFKRVDGYPHAQECFLGHYEAAVREALRHKHKYAVQGRNLFKDGEQVDPGEVPDEFVFIPKNFERKSADIGVITTGFTALRTKDERVQYVVHQVKIKTQSLERLAAIYSHMSERDKRTFFLTINGRKRTYWDTFKPVWKLEEGATEPFIYFGVCSIYPYKAYGYTIFFSDKVAQYNTAMPNITATILVEHTTERYAPSLHKQLAEFTKNVKVRRLCYVFGHEIHVSCYADSAEREKYCRTSPECVTFKLDAYNMHRLAVLPNE
jgi:hypothetical protein